MLIEFIVLSLMCVLQFAYIEKLKKELNFRQDIKTNTTIKTTVIKALSLVAVVFVLELINISVVFTILFFIVTSFKAKKITKEIKSIDERS